MQPTYILLPSELFHRVYETAWTSEVIGTLKDLGLSAALRVGVGVEISFDAHRYAPGLAPLFANFRPGFTVVKDLDCGLPGPALPLPLLQHLLDIFADTLRTGLTGHEMMELLAAFAAAPTLGAPIAEDPRIADPGDFLPLPAHYPDPASAGQPLAVRMAAEIAALDADLADYRAALAGSHLEGTIATLGQQSEIAQALMTGISRAEDGACQELLLPARSWARMDRCEAALNAADALSTGAADLVPENEYGGRPLHGFTILRAHAGMFQGVFNAYTLKGPGRIKERISPADRPIVQLRDDDAMSQMHEWAKAFRLERWSNLPWVFRLGLGHLVFQQLRPFEDGNGRIGRLMMVMQMIEMGLPALPLEAALLRHHAQYLQAIGDAIATGDPEPFIRCLIAACREAIGISHRLLEELRPLHERLLAAIRATGQVMPAVDAVGRWLGRLLLEEGDVECLVDGPVDAIIGHLEGAGLLQQMVIRDRQFWTIPGVRESLQAAIGE